VFLELTEIVDTGSPDSTEIIYVDPNRLLDREAKRRLAVIRHVEEVSGNVALSSRDFGVSRQAHYSWCRSSAGAS
jgi:hypothetical protein